MIILVDKEVGMTSFDVIRELRKKLKIRKMGHAGTLDPLASGLLIVATEDDTKKLEEFLKLPKTYEVLVRIGERRSTGDLEGDVLEKIEVADIPEEKIQEVVDGFVKIHSLAVPKYSAVKVAGKPLYWYARNNKEAEAPVKDMTVHEVKLLDISKGEGVVDVKLCLSVSSGTYIRSLAEEFGRQLGYPATTASLRRTSVGDWSVSDAKKIADID